MYSKVQLIIYFYLINTGVLLAQWSEKDSIWVKDSLPEGGQIRLNPEFQKAIESGTLIRNESPLNKQLSAPPLLPITKEFTGIKPEDLPDGKPIDSIPPAVLLRQHIPGDSTLLRINLKLPEKKLLEKEEFKLGPVSTSVTAEDAFLPEVKDGQRRGVFKLKTRATFSLEDGLRYLFLKSERAKKRNKKRANAWKTYNDLP